MQRMRALARQKEKRYLTFRLLSKVLVLLVVCSVFVMPQMKSNASSARMVKQFVGSMVCTTYHVSDNTPRGTRATATGAVAQEYHTIAVDGRNPRFPIGTKLYVEGFGWGVVEDTGGFGKYGVSLDLFTPENVGFKKPCKVWVYRKETKKEKQKRLAKIRRKRQKQPFRILFETDLPAGTCITDKKYIPKGSTVILENLIVECIDNELDLGNTIRIGIDVDDNNFRDISKFLENCTYVTKLKEVIENGKG